MPKPRSQCNCHCHMPGITVRHIVACCRPDICGHDTTPAWIAKKMPNFACVCLLDAGHDGDHKCRHDLDDAA